MSVKLATVALAIAFIMGISVVVPSISTAVAQDAATSSQATKSSTSTTTSAVPSQSRTTTTTTVDPIWFVVGGVGLLALIGIIALASRSGKETTVVTERDTVIRE